MPRSVYLIAGEASGDALGAGLMQALNELHGDEVEFLGIGGEKMEAEGLNSLFPYHELSLMGFSEIIPHARELMARIRQTAEHILVKQPDVVVTIDSPGFNFRVVERIRKSGEAKNIRFVHYVAPSVWAYKPERAAKCARLFDHLLALLPFEPPYFEAEGLSTTFVGHPVALLPQGDGAAFRAEKKIAPDVPLIALFPGSRKQEIKRHMEVFGAAVARLGASYPNLVMAVPVSLRLLPLVARYFQGCPYPTILITDEKEKRDAIAAATVALVKSGTVSLEVAQGGCPQVVAYRTGRITAMLVRRMVRIKLVNLVNLILGREVIPEFLQERCTADMLAAALGNLLSHPELRKAQAEQGREALAQLRPEGETPHRRAAKAIMGVMV